MIRAAKATTQITQHGPDVTIMVAAAAFAGLLWIGVSHPPSSSSRAGIALWQAPRLVAVVDEAPKVSTGAVDIEAAEIREEVRQQAVRIIAPESDGPARPAHDLATRFVTGGYTLDGVRRGEEAVPRILLAKLPADLSSLNSRELRKNIFLKSLLPLVLDENERLARLRARLVVLRDLIAAGGTLAAFDREFLVSIAERFGADEDDLDAMLRRVDVVPPSLALAQAALESGWGTSRGALQAQNLFGHMSFPYRDPARAVLQTFESAPAAVASYMHNLNTHRAYEAFRERRARMRARDLEPDGFELAGDLLRYSERAHDYVRDVRILIRSNDLQAFDRARLDG
jgi:Bax protein